MTDQPLHDRAAAAGVATGYVGQDGGWVAAAPASVEAVLALLGPTPPEVAAAAAGPPLPAWSGPRAWGLSVFLPGVRSAGSWGVGDAVDLASLGRYAAGLGADALLLNPTRAELPVAPVEPSPYLPASRLFDGLWLLRPDAVPEAALLAPADRLRLEQLAEDARRSCLTRIDYSHVLQAKWDAVMLLAGAVTGARRADRDAFAAARPSLPAFADWWIHVRRHGADPERWPHPPLPAPPTERAAVVSAQWWIDEQLAAGQRACREAGMRIGVVADLPVGVHPLGFDPWHLGPMLVRGAAVGAPPDGYNALGQDWSQPPWHPHLLAAADARPFADTVTHALRHAGALRVDHILGLFRSWWIPDGFPATEGVYVRNPVEALLAALITEARAAGAFVVGEDLGTVGPEVRSRLAQSGLLGTELALFAAGPDGAPAPDGIRPGVLAAISTHDLPSPASWLRGEHLVQRQELGLLPDPAAAWAQWRQQVAAWRQRWVDDHLLPESAADDVDAQVLAWHRWLAATPAPLIAVQLGDLVGDRRPVNVPGTVDEHPNWRLPLADGDGEPVDLERLPTMAQPARLAAAVSAGRGLVVG